MKNQNLQAMRDTSAQYLISTRATIIKLSLVCLTLTMTTILPNTVRALPSPICRLTGGKAQFIDESTASPENQKSTDVTDENFSHNMRLDAIKCCLKSDSNSNSLSERDQVTGFFLRFKSIQNGPFLDFFAAEEPKYSQTQCLGVSCASGCTQFKTFEQFPVTEKPLSQLHFWKDQGSGIIKDIFVQTEPGVQTQMCGSETPDATREQAIISLVTYPLVGVDVMRDTTHIYSIQPVFNFCSYHGRSALELELNSPLSEPIQIQVSDQEHILNNQLFGGNIELPVRNQFITKPEYNLNLGSLPCAYSLQAIEPLEIPSYLSIAEINSKSYLTFSNQIQNWPFQAQHDRVSIVCSINSVFENIRTVDIIFYEVDYDSIMVLPEPDNCIDQVFDMGWTTGLDLDQNVLKSHYRAYKETRDMICCVNSQQEVYIVDFVNPQNSNISIPGVSCYTTPNVNFSDLISWTFVSQITVSGAEALKQLSFQRESTGFTALCSSAPAGPIITNTFTVEEHGEPLQFRQRQDTEDFLRLVGLKMFTNKCQLNLKELDLQTLSPNEHLFVHGSPAQTFEFPAEIPFLSTSTFESLTRQNQQIIDIYEGFQPSKSQERFEWHSRMLGYQQYSQGPILFQQTPNFVQVAPYNQVPLLANKEFSYIVYLEDTFVNQIFTVRLSLLHLVVRMKIEGTEDPVEVIPDPQCFLDDFWLQSYQLDHQIFIEDFFDSQKSLQIPSIPTICNPEQYRQDFQITKTLEIFVDGQKVTNNLIKSTHVLESDNFELDFAGNRQNFEGLMSVQLIQKTDIFLAQDGDRQAYFVEFSEQLGFVELYSRCDTLQILPIQLDSMNASIGDSRSKMQFIPPLEDENGLLTEGKCGEFEFFLEIVQGDELPESVLSLNGVTINLNSTAASSDMAGQYKAKLVYFLLTNGFEYEVEFDVRLTYSPPRTRDQIDEIINSQPEFSGVPLGVSKLEPLSAPVGQLAYYSLPAIVDRNSDDVRVSLAIGDSLLANCDCIELLDDQTIQFVLPLKYAGRISSIQVFLDDGKTKSFYYFFVLGLRSADDQNDDSSKSTDSDPTNSQGNTSKQGNQFFDNGSGISGGIITLEQQVMLNELTLSSEDLDETNQFKISGPMTEYCLPKQVKMSNSGFVKIRFSRNLKPILVKNQAELLQQIVDTGSIQIQIIDESQKVGKQSLDKSFSWYVEEIKPTEITLQLVFENPQFLSSQANMRDRLRIIFVETTLFLKCESIYDFINFEDENKDNNLVNAAEQLKRDFVPQNYQVFGNVPPQVSQKQLQEAQAIREMVDAPTKTVFFTSIAFAAFSNVSLQNIWSSINALQIVANLPLYNLNFPFNSMVVFQFLSEVVAFDLFAPTDHFDFGFTGTDPVNDRFEDQGFEQINFIENLGSIGLLGILLVLRHTFVPALLGCCASLSLCRCWRNFMARFRLTVPDATNAWLRFGLQTYFELCMSVLIGLKLRPILNELPQGEVPTWQDELAVYTTYVFAAIALGLPLFVGYMTFFHVRPYVRYQKAKEEIKNAKFRREVYQQSRFMVLLDYGPNIFFVEKETTEKAGVAPFTESPRSSPKNNSTNQEEVTQYALQRKQTIVVEAMKPPKRRNCIVKRPSDLLTYDLEGKNFDYMKYVEELFKELKPYQISAQPFYFFHLLRRIIFILVALYLMEYPFVQILFYMGQSIAMAVFLVSKRVFYAKSANLLEIWNEILILIVGYHMVIFMSANLDHTRRNAVGITLIICVGGLISLNTLKYVWDQFRDTIRKMRRTRYRYVHKQAVETKRQLIRKQSKILESLKTMKTYATMNSSREERISLGLMTENEKELDVGFELTDASPFRRIDSIGSHYNQQLIQLGPLKYSETPRRFKDQRKNEDLVTIEEQNRRPRLLKGFDPNKTGSSWRTEISGTLEENMDQENGPEQIEIPKLINFVTPKNIDNEDENEKTLVQEYLNSSFQPEKKLNFQENGIANFASANSARQLLQQDNSKPQIEEIQHNDSLKIEEIVNEKSKKFSSDRNQGLYPIFLEHLPKFDRQTPEIFVDEPTVPLDDNTLNASKLKDEHQNYLQPEAVYDMEFFKKHTMRSNGNQSHQNGIFGCTTMKQDDRCKIRLTCELSSTDMDISNDISEGIDSSSQHSQEKEVEQNGVRNEQRAFSHQRITSLDGLIPNKLGAASGQLGFGSVREESGDSGILDQELTIKRL